MGRCVDPVPDSPYPASLPALARALRSGVVELPAYLDALEARVAECEPSLLALVPEDGRFRRLRREAAELLAAYPDPDARPPLFGVPAGVKDIMHVEGMLTRAGSRLPPAELQGPQAEVVTQLRRSGALVLGKTVSTEFAYFGPGPTRNPYNPEHTPGGSSSGSAAAVAASLCPLALGTQTIGSIIRPAAFCGVVGFKPSYDRISAQGVIPLSPSLDHIGLFSADAAGAALAASLLCRNWRTDVPQRRPVLAIPEGPYLAHAAEEARGHFRAACARLEQAGYAVLSVEALPDFDAIRERHAVIVAGEAARVHAQWYERYSALYHRKTAELIQRGQKVSDQVLAEARRGRKQLRLELTHLMNLHGIDLWLSPAAPGPAPRGLDSTGDPVMNLPWTHSGLPAASVPAGQSGSGLPLGLQLTARWHADELLLAWAPEIEETVRPVYAPAAR